MRPRGYVNGSIYARRSYCNFENNLRNADLVYRLNACVNTLLKEGKIIWKNKRVRNTNWRPCFVVGSVFVVQGREIAYLLFETVYSSS